ncbi:hypothetical protein [Umezawaea sp.]|uniref:hypothetical protein n=1 Tax=Umezawaea sp. TaxID=1955258 RepID=UPI002ECFF6AA
MKTNVQRHLNQALMRIPRRAENTDRHTLATTYVSAGSFSAMLHSTDHQVLYGRRGTGKTHALLYLSDVIERAGDLPVYLDLRTIGSAGGIHSGSDADAAERGTHLLVDTLEAVHEELLTIAVDTEHDMLDPLDALADAATAVQVVGEVERESKRTGSAETRHALDISATPSAKVTAERRNSTSSEHRLRRVGVERHHVVFGPLSRALRGLTRALGGRRLWLLLDEWSSVPLDLQPLLADLLRRCVLPVPGITVKIAAIERRSRFSVPAPAGDYIGIELGADAATAVSLDDFLVFNRARTDAQEFFGQLFFNHAKDLLVRVVGARAPGDATAFVERTFQRNAFLELVRAAEGVPRDAINIAALAAQYAHSDVTDLEDVRRAARDWYLRDKQTAIDSNPAAHSTLRKLVDEVVGKRRSRTFLLERTASAEHPAVDVLYDARLLHVLRRGIVDKNHPGTLYDGFAVDYGCYVALLLDGELPSRPRHRGGWLNWSHSVPPDGFDFGAEAIDLSTLD